MAYVGDGKARPNTPGSKGTHSSDCDAGSLPDPPRTVFGRCVLKAVEIESVR